MKKHQTLIRWLRLCVSNENCFHIPYDKRNLLAQTIFSGTPYSYTIYTSESVSFTATPTPSSVTKYTSSGLGGIWTQIPTRFARPPSARLGTEKRTRQERRHHRQRLRPTVTEVPRDRQQIFPAIARIATSRRRQR